MSLTVQKSSNLNCVFILGSFVRSAGTQDEKPTHDFLPEFLDEIHAGNIKQYLRYTHTYIHTHLSYSRSANQLLSFCRKGSSHVCPTWREQSRTYDWLSRFGRSGQHLGLTQLSSCGMMFCSRIRTRPGRTTSLQWTSTGMRYILHDTTSSP